MKHVAYHRLAASELINSASFYESRVPRLGDVFISAVEKARDEFAANPKLGKPGKNKTRSWKIKRLPFRIVYLEQADRLLVVAVAHLNRRPDYWSRRLNVD